MKIIIIDHEPYTARRGKQFFESEFVKDGYCFEFWSIWKLLTYTKNIEYRHYEEQSNVQYLTSWSELKSKLASQLAINTFFFVECWFNSSSWKVFYYLNRGKFNWGKLDYYQNPTVNFYFNSQNQIDQSLTNVIKIGDKMKNFVSNLNNLDYLTFQILCRMNFAFLKRIMKPKAVFQAGTYVKDPFPNTEYYPLKYFDIETFDVEINKVPILEYNYIVFADIYLGKHPDLEINHGPDYLDLDRYYTSLDIFFTKIEKYTGMPVVIAAHPKSDYTLEFGDRVVLRNKTANLVINSKLFLHHGSLSITFALLAKKPIVSFYNTDFLVNGPLLTFVKLMNNLAKQLDIKTINIDDFQDYSSLCNMKINEFKYEEVLNKYFRGDGLNLTNYEVIKSGLLQQFK